MRSLSLVMSECSLSGRRQGHVSNFYIVDLKNFTTASLYTGDIHNSTVVSLFMTPIRQWKPLECITVECTCLLHIGLQLHNFDLFRTCRTRVSALLHGNWQDFNWYNASRGPSAIAELLVYTVVAFSLYTSCFLLYLKVKILFLSVSVTVIFMLTLWNGKWL